jgi:DNA-binding beta-propeller fold protein YncE
MSKPVYALLVAALVGCASVGAGDAARGDMVPTAGTVVARVHVPNAPLGLAVTPGAVWVGAHRSAFVYRIDSVANRVAAKIKVEDSNGGAPGSMLSVDGRVVDANYFVKTIAFINPKTNTAKIVGVRFESCCLPVMAAGSLWVLGVSTDVAQAPDRLSRLDPKTGRVMATRAIGNAAGLVYGASSLWASSNDRIIRLDLKSGRTIARLPVQGEPFAFGDGDIWALENDTVNNQAHVLRIDPATGSVVANIELPNLATFVTAAPNGTIWVAENSGISHPHLWTIDPATNALAGQVDLGNVTSSIQDLVIAADGTVWVSLFDANLVLRIQPS